MKNIKNQIQILLLEGVDFEGNFIDFIPPINYPLNTY